MRRLGVVAALPGEAAALAGRPCTPGLLFELGTRTLVLVAGIGSERAGVAARRLVERGAEALVSWGVAGGLEPGLASGALVVPGSVLGSDGARFETDAAWSDRLARAATGRQCSPQRAALLEALRVIETGAAKRAAHRASGACAVDMESAAIADVARASGLPFIAVRAISDAAQDDLPPASLSAIDGDGRVRKTALLRSLARHPGQLAGLWRMQRAWHAALGSLRRVAQAAGPDLCAEPEVSA